MMCRVTAPSVAHPLHEEVSRIPDRPIASIHRVVVLAWRRMRMARHRASRWFVAPVCDLVRERRTRDLGIDLLLR